MSEVRGEAMLEAKVGEEDVSLDIQLSNFTHRVKGKSVWLGTEDVFEAIQDSC